MQLAAVRMTGETTTVPRATSEEKLRRDPQVIQDRARGLPWNEISGRHNLSEKMCRVIWNDHLCETPLEATDLRSALVEALLQYDAAIGDLASLAESTTNDPVRLGAIKARVEVMGKRQELARRAGLLPDPVHDAIRSQQTQAVTEAFIDTFRKFVPAELHDQAEFELLETLRPSRSAA